MPLYAVRWLVVVVVVYTATMMLRSALVERQPPAPIDLPPAEEGRRYTPGAPSTHRPPVRRTRTPTESVRASNCSERLTAVEKENRSTR